MQDLRVDTGRVRLQIRDSQQDGDAIIFLHFSGANLMMWERAVPYFRDQYRLILVDLRGHGKSDKPRTGYHMDEMACDVTGVMERLGLDRAHVVGSSLGAEVGLGIAANHPEKVITLVCDGALYSEYGPCGTWGTSEEAFRQHVTSTLERMRSKPETVFPSVDALVDNQREVFEACGWWNTDLEAVTRYDADKIGEGKVAFGWRNPAKANYMEHYFGYRFEDSYRRVKCPVLMLPEDDQPQEEKAAMERLGKLALDATIVSVPGWIHPYGWLLDPEKMCETILEFLAAVR